MQSLYHIWGYRVLCKIAIDLIPRDTVEKYASAIKWIKGVTTPMSVPNVLYSYHKDIINQPIAKVYLCNNIGNNGYYPLVLMSLRIMDLTFLYTIPFGNDTASITHTELNNILGCLMPDDAIAYEFIEMDDRIGKFAHVTEWIDKSDCMIIDQNDLNHVQEKNPNKVNFPEFKRNKVKVISNTIREVTFGAIDNNSVKLEECSISKHYVKPVFPNASDTIGIKWSLTVDSLFENETLFSASGVVVARIKNFTEVVNTAVGEMSSFLTEYLLEQAFLKLNEQISARYPHFKFCQLADLLMQADGRIMHPRNDTVQTSMIPYLHSVRP